MRDRFIQLGAAAVLVLGVTGAGFLQPKMLEISDRDQLRYTDESVQGAPPIVAIGTAIGALRGLIVDYLWLKVTIQKEKGLLYEVMADADLITKLQPRFPEVWSFHGHNLAYNISVMTNTPEERWAWVNAGISLVRERGIRYNRTTSSCARSSRSGSRTRSTASPTTRTSTTSGSSPASGISRSACRPSTTRCASRG